MVALREVLSRFRSAGVPGALAGAVPADREAGRDAELEPVFGALDGAEAEARGIRARAAEQAEAIRAEGARRAEAIVREAVARAPDECEQAARRTRLDTDEYCATVIERSRTRAESVRSRAEPRLRALVDRIVAEAAARLRPREPGPGR
jgi:hypothetical protein